MTRLRSFTLLEALIAAVILTGGIGLALSLFIRTDSAVGDTLAHTDHELRANRFDAFLRSELSSVDRDSIRLFDTGEVPGAYTRMEWQPVTGYSGSSPTLGALRRLDFTLDSGETRNNADDDGDGLIDEGEISFWVDTSGNGSLEAGERAVRLINVASEPEEYVSGAGGVGGDFVFRIEPSNSDQVVAGDARVLLNYTLLGREPSTGRVRLITRNSNTFTFMN